MCVLRRMVNDDVDAATAATAYGDDDADTHVHGNMMMMIMMINRERQVVQMVSLCWITRMVKMVKMMMMMVIMVMIIATMTMINRERQEEVLRKRGSKAGYCAANIFFYLDIGQYDFHLKIISYQETSRKYCKNCLFDSTLQQ